MHDSFVCPPAFVDPAPPLKPGRVLRRFVFREFDFEEVVSDRESTAISICEQMLLNGDLAAGKTLWEALLAVANKVRTQGGFMDLPKLLTVLRERFSFRAHPDFAADWRNLNESTQRHLDLIDGRLGGTLHVPRPAELKLLNDRLQKSKKTFVRGASGSGKSALVKTFAEEKPRTERQIIWVRGENLQRFPEKSIAQIMGLQWPLGQLLATSTAKESILVIDGVENCHSREAYLNIKSLVEACSVDSAESTWKVLFLCQDEEFPSGGRRYS